jgi:putative toxin-antitoxin system antitoxin component (TIGR02293 family)
MKVEEPLALYGIKPINLFSDIEIIKEARKGIETSMLWDFLKAIKTTKADFEKFLPSSLKTFTRKEKLNEAMSERVLSVIKVFKMGEDVFGDTDKLKLWLERYNPILGDKPSSFMTTSTGCQVVIDELGRAQHGIMA